ncbi:hypothetical protein Dimus_014583 [Dionaea muscipula]
MSRLQFQRSIILLVLSSLVLLVVATPRSPRGGGGGGGRNETSKWVLIPKYTHVSLTNGLGDGLSLTVHCQSDQNHDTIGTVVIADGQTFDWRFKPNFWGTTEWFCNFIWQDAIGTYDIYVYKRDHHLCGKHCQWYINRQGLFGPGPGSSQIYFSWPSLV